MSRVTTVTEKRKRTIVEVVTNGYNISQAAEKADITRKTIYLWIKADKKFAKDMKRADESRIKIEIDMVKSALLKRACGYEYNEVHTENGEVKKVITKQVAPDTGAIVFYLCNRDKDNFKNTQKIEHSNDPDNPIGIIINGVNLTNFPGMGKTSVKGKSAK